MITTIRMHLSRLSRPQKRLLQVGFDLLALWVVVWCAYLLRLGLDFRPNGWQLGFMAVAPLLAIPFFVRLGLYRAILRYLPNTAALTIIKAMSLGAMAWMGVIFLAEASGGDGVPRSIPIIYWILGILVIGSSRFAAKAFLTDPADPDAPARRALIYGAGKSGTQLMTGLRAGGDRSVVGFLDDDPALRGHDVAGARVYDPADLPALIADFGITDVILSMPSAPASRRMEIATALAPLPVTLATLPSISELAAGRYSISQLKQIDIEDLLGRSSVAPDPALIEPVVAGKTVLVTGAGGSIGSELCHLVIANAPATIILFEMGEFALYEIERRLRAAPLPPATQRPTIIPVLGSVADRAAVDTLFAGHRIDVVFHAAAYKHVPLVEANVLEGVRNNVLGTMNLVEAARAHGAERFVLISSDKAVRPTSVMGATKRLSELVVRHHANAIASAGSNQKILAVRFGNVLGSTGSVVPLFKEQIARGGPITLTDKRMTRYFMAIGEAAQLIVQAAGLSRGGEIFLLDMGEPVRIEALAENMVRLAGLRLKTPENPDGDIAIIETGIRPGEKLYEELYYDPAAATPTAHPKISAARSQSLPVPDMIELRAELESHLAARNTPAIRTLLERTTGLSEGS